MNKNRWAVTGACSAAIAVSLVLTVRGLAVPRPTSDGPPRARSATPVAAPSVAVPIGLVGLQAYICPDHAAGMTPDQIVGQLYEPPESKAQIQAIVAYDLTKCTGGNNG